MAAAKFKREWADGPLPLVQSPVFKLRAAGKLAEDDPAVLLIASDMSQVHNAITRSLNSMLLQAPHLTLPQDQNDMTTFAYAVVVFIHDHHLIEEAIQFPLIEQAIGQPGIMEKNAVQHEEFGPALHHFEMYVRQMQNKVAVWDAKKFTDMIMAFADMFTRHLHDELNTLMELEKYGVRDWRPTMERVKKFAMSITTTDYNAPLYFQSLDNTFEDGIHDYDPVPWPVKYILRWLFVPKHKGAWRFATCDTYGQPKELPFAPLKKTVAAEESE